MNSRASVAASWRFAAGLAVFTASIGFMLGSAVVLGLLVPNRFDLWVAIGVAMDLIVAVLLYRSFLVEAWCENSSPIRLGDIARDLRQAGLLLGVAELGMAVLLLASRAIGVTPYGVALDMPSTLSASTISADVLLGPLFEELTFRWILYRTLRQRLRQLPSAAISAVVFALLHISELRDALSLFWLGVVLAMGVERFRRFVPIVAAHAGFNLISICIGWT